MKRRRGDHVVRLGGGNTQRHLAGEAVADHANLAGLHTHLRQQEIGIGRPVADHLLRGQGAEQDLQRLVHLALVIRLPAIRLDA